MNRINQAIAAAKESLDSDGHRATDALRDLLDATRMTERHIEVLTIERDHARAQADSTIQLLTDIYRLLHPEDVHTADGKTYQFTLPTSFNVGALYRELSARIRALPYKIGEIEQRRVW